MNLSVYPADRFSGILMSRIRTTKRKDSFAEGTHHSVFLAADLCRTDLRKIEEVIQWNCVKSLENRD